MLDSFALTLAASDTKLASNTELLGDVHGEAELNLLKWRNLRDSLILGLHGRFLTLARRRLLIGVPSSNFKLRHYPSPRHDEVSGMTKHNDDVEGAGA